MAEIQDLNVTDASNVARWPENMQFSAVNDAGRADEGLLARWYKDMDASVVASGSSNAFTATSNRTISSLVNNTIITFEANHTISGSATFNLNGLGAKTIKRFSGDTLTSGDITSGQPVMVIYKSSPDCWYMLNAASALDTSVTFIDFTENAAPGTPASDVGRLFASDQGGLTALAVIDSAATSRTVLTTATQAEMEAATSTIRSASAATQHHHPGHPKAWGYISSASAINASYNVASVASGGTGLYNVTLTNAMSSVNFAVIATGVQGTNGKFIDVTITSTSVIQFRVVSSAGALNDNAFFFAVFGDM